MDNGINKLLGCDELDERLSDSYVEIAKLFVKSTPSWLPSWLEFFLLPTGRYDVLLHKSKPSRTLRFKELKSKKDQILGLLKTARSSPDEPLVRSLASKLSRIDARINQLNGAAGNAKSGPGKNNVTPKILMAARLIEIYLFLNGKLPSSRNHKLAIALISLLDTLGAMRAPVGNPLNGARWAFEAALSVSNKVNNPALRLNDATFDEIALARILTRRSLQQCEILGRAPWYIPGMNGVVNIHGPKEI